MKCYLCESEYNYISNEGTRTDLGVNILTCSNCGLVFTDKLKDVEFYKKDGLAEDTAVDTMDIVDTERRYKRFSPLFVDKKVLDFGCGKGMLLKKIKDNCLTREHITALEPNKIYREYLANNFSLYLGIDSLPNGYFDCITMFHVLEHLPNPREVLLELYKKLDNGGKIIIEVPNVDDVMLKTYKDFTYRNFIFTAWHLYYFNIPTLTKLLEQTKFRINYIQGFQRYSLANHLYWLTNAKPGGHLQYHYLDIDEYKHRLAELGQTDTLIAEVEKCSDGFSFS